MWQLTEIALRKVVKTGNFRYENDGLIILSVLALRPCGGQLRVLRNLVADQCRGY
jgi:hypothetical protein